MPWFSAIANSLQAGFWEECLFRAVPIAGAALIGDRFGKRRLFIVLGFIVQVVIFGSGHAPYPTQPSFARPVELILPSIGFGLLYLYFGLLPGIVLHFIFDTVWFALPLFVATAPGIWIQRTMVVPVASGAALDRPLAARAARGVDRARSRRSQRRAGRPSRPPAPPVETPRVESPHAIGPRARLVWLGLGAAQSDQLRRDGHERPRDPRVRRSLAAQAVDMAARRRSRREA